MEIREDRISELQDVSIIFNKKHRKKKKKTRNGKQILRHCGTVATDLTFVSSECQKERRKNEGLKRYSKK